MKICTACRKEKPLTEFYRARNRKDGYNFQCKACLDSANKVSREKDKKRYNGYRLQWKRELVNRINKWKSDCGCHVCNETESCCLELHHPDPSTKENHPSLMRTSWERYMAEASKCVIVCSNCHKKIHAGLIVVK